MQFHNRYRPIAGVALGTFLIVACGEAVTVTDGDGNTGGAGGTTTAGNGGSTVGGAAGLGGTGGAGAASGAGGSVAECSDATGCNDDNECTDDACESGQCSHEPVNNGTPCDSGSCVSGVCQPIQAYYRTDEAIYSIALDPSAQPKQLTQPLIDGGYIGRFAVATSGRVVYSAAVDRDDGTDLYSVRTDGTGLAELSHDTLSVTLLQITPDGQRVVYTAYDNAGGRSLYVVDVDGGNLTQLAAGWVNSYFSLSRDGKYVGYMTERPDADSGIFVASLDGAEQIKIATTSELTGIQAVIVNDAAPTAVYFSQRELFHGGADGTTKLNRTLLQGRVFDPVLTPGDDRVIYRAIEDVPWTWSVYSTRLDGTDSVRLSGDIDAGPLWLSPDGTHVVYQSDYQLYATTPTGGTSTQLTANSTVGVANTTTLTDTHTVFVADGALVSSTYDGARATLGQDLVTERLKLTPDRQRVVFTASAGQAHPGVYSVSLTGGDWVQVHDAEAGGGWTFMFVPSPDNQQVVFEVRDAGAPSEVTHQLWVGALDGSGSFPLNANNIPPGRWDEDNLIVR